MSQSHITRHDAYKLIELIAKYVEVSVECEQARVTRTFQQDNRGDGYSKRELADIYVWRQTMAHYILGMTEEAPPPRHQPSQPTPPGR